MTTGNQSSFGAAGLAVAVAATLLGGCTAPVEREQTASSSQPLNTIGIDFQVGIVGVKYVGSKAYKSSEAWTDSFSNAAFSESMSTYSGWTSVLSGATGLRIGLKNLGSGSSPPILQAVDFRIVVGVRNHDSGVAPIYIRSAWASEVGGQFDTPEIAVIIDPDGTVYTPDQFMVGIEERPYLTQGTLRDFYLGIATGNPTDGLYANFTREVDYYGLEGQEQWSHTSEFSAQDPDVAIIMVSIIPD
jgi:hypothetical protein